MKCTKDALEMIIKEQYGSVPKLAKKIGMSEQTIYTCIKGNLVNSYMTTSMPIIAALNLDPFQLMDGYLSFRSPQDKSYIDVPLYTVADNMSRYLKEAGNSGTIPNVKHEEYPNAFLFKVSDCSMNRLFPVGTFVLVDPISEVECPGQPYVVFTAADGVSLKYAFPLRNGVELVPFSTDTTIRSAIYDYNDETSDVSIIGRIVWCTFPLDWDCPAIPTSRPILSH